jgi:hypothetical protein
VPKADSQISSHQPYRTPARRGTDRYPREEDRLFSEKPRFLTYPEWLQARIEFVYVERLRERRARGPKHSEKRRAQWRAYKATEKGAASRVTYERSLKARETRARYEASMPGTMARTKAQLNARRAAHAAQWDALNARPPLVGSFDADR